MRKELWEIVEVCESNPFEEEDGYWIGIDKETLVTIQPIDGDFCDSEALSMPLSENGSGKNMSETSLK